MSHKIYKRITLFERSRIVISSYKYRRIFKSRTSVRIFFPIKLQMPSIKDQRI